MKANYRPFCIIHPWYVKWLELVAKVGLWRRVRGYPPFLFLSLSPLTFSYPFHFLISPSSLFLYFDFLPLSSYFLYSPTTPLSFRPSLPSYSLLLFLQIYLFLSLSHRFSLSGFFDLGEKSQLLMRQKVLFCTLPLSLSFSVIKTASLE